MHAVSIVSLPAARARGIRARSTAAVYFCCAQVPSLRLSTMAEGGTLQNYNAELVNCIEEVPLPSWRCSIRVALGP